MDFNKQTKRTVNFLVFCYFGITMECEKVKGIDGISRVEASRRSGYRWCGDKKSLS